MVTLSFLRHFVEDHATLAYILIILGVLFEGEIVVIIAGIFSHLGSLNIFISFGAAVMGGILKSCAGYALGFYIQKHSSKQSFAQKVARRVDYFFPNFTRKPFLSIFLSRFLILGLNWFALVYSGYKKIAIHIYAKAEALSLLAWSIGVLALGYFFSYTALSISRDVRKFLGIILVCFIAFFILQKVFAFIIELVSIGKGLPPSDNNK